LAPPLRLFPDNVTTARLTINIAYQSRKHLSAKVRSFVDFMAEQFRQNQFERKWTSRYGGEAADTL
jgi:DNA-binding transcriptional LysR family regulator